MDRRAGQRAPGHRGYGAAERIPRRAAGHRGSPVRARASPGAGRRGGAGDPGREHRLPLAYATEAVRAGVRLLLGARVTAVRADSGEHWLSTSRGTLRSRWLVNAAGLDGDRVDAMLGGDGGFTIRPRRGELIVFDKLARPLLGSILLP